MEFPAFRSEEWMKFAFAPMKREDWSAQSPSSHSSGEEEKGRENVKPFYPPEFCLSGLYIMPSYLANFPPSGRFVHRIQQVQRSIKRALFRQSIFKIQNVEVLELKRCRRPRRLVACEVLYDIEEQKKGKLSGHREAVRRSRESFVHGRSLLDQSSSPPGSSDLNATRTLADSSSQGAVNVSTVPAHHDSAAVPSPSEDSARMDGLSSLFPRTWFSWRGGGENRRRQGEARSTREDENVLREERWSIDRCGSIRDYIITVTQDKATGDFFGVTVEPVALTDKLRQIYFNFFDRTSAED